MNIVITWYLKINCGIIFDGKRKIRDIAFFKGAFQIVARWWDTRHGSSAIDVSPPPPAVTNKSDNLKFTLYQNK